MRLHVRSVAVPGTPPLADLLARLPAAGRLAFLGGDVGFVGSGRAVTIEVGAGPRRGEAAWAQLSRVLHDAEVEDRVGLPGSGPVAIGSLTFDPTATGSVLVIPEVVVGQGSGRTWITTAALGAAPPEAPVLDIGPIEVRSGSDRPRFAGSSLRDDAWLAAVHAAVAAIDAGELEKVVLARDHLLWSEDPFDVPGLVRVLAARFIGCRTFLVDGLVGASPEPMLHVAGERVRSRVLAGTAPRGWTPEEDAALWARLIASDKDRREHTLAVDSVTAALGAVGASVIAPDVPSRLALDNLQHLATDISARLPERMPGLAILDLLHPTAAVAGTPRDVALARIRATEGMDRGRYAGPVGWTDAAGDGEWALALRCAEVDGTRARLLAGAGIVAGSLPELELRETQLKLRAMLRVLEGLGAERPAEEAAVGADPA